MPFRVCRTYTQQKNPGSVGMQNVVAVRADRCGLSTFWRAVGDIFLVLVATRDHGCSFDRE